jgi:acyl carrier protein
VWATAGAIADEAESGTRRGVSIGRALAHAETLILDDRGQLVSLGVVGELCVGGAGIARGYHESPAATAQRFVPNPCAATDRDATILYRTGDLVRARPNGELEFVGRADHQVKVRGVRIEPEEIERAFRQAFTVSDVMVDVVEEAPGRKTLRLSYVRVHAADDRESTAIDRAQVRAVLGRALPAALLPDEVQEVESLPRLANGKLDRRAASRLRARSSRSLPIEIRAPSSEIQRALAGVWREVLGVDAVGVTQNFFDIGGDSLLANQIVLRAAKVFGAKVPLKDFYQRPTVAAHADFIKRQGDGMGLDLERVAAIWNQLD